MYCSYIEHTKSVINVDVALHNIAHLFSTSQNKVDRNRIATVL